MTQKINAQKIAADKADEVVQKLQATKNNRSRLARIRSAMSKMSNLSKLWEGEITDEVFKHQDKLIRAAAVNYFTDNPSHDANNFNTDTHAIHIIEELKKMDLNLSNGAVRALGSNTSQTRQLNV